MEAGFYQQVIDVVESVDEEESIVHIFAVIDSKEKANKVYSLIENELKSNYQRILSKKRIRKSSAGLNTSGNTFNRYVQEFFCEQPNHFPKRVYHDYGDFIGRKVIAALPESQTGAWRFLFEGGGTSGIPERRCAVHERDLASQ